MQKTNATKTNRIAGLDLLRAIAIILVFIFHWQNKVQAHWLAWISKFGWTGVDLFFVLSGYLIARQLFKSIQIVKRPSLKIFYINRSFRILPAYITVLAFYFFNIYTEFRFRPIFGKWLFSCLVIVCRRAFLLSFADYSFFRLESKI